MATSSAQRVIFLACGSFNPPTNMHLRLFELARDHFRANQPLSTVLGGVISPTHDAYKKSSLIPSTHRLSMARLAASQSSSVTVSDWEVKQEGWSRTRLVLDEYTQLAKEGTAEWLPSLGSPDQGPVTFKLLCGADLLESFAVPDLWNTDDLTTIVRDYGIVVISRFATRSPGKAHSGKFVLFREGSNPEKFIYNSDLLTRYQHNIHIITEWIANEGEETMQILQGPWH